MFDFVSTAIVVLLLLVFGFLAFRSWRAKRMLWKLLGGIVFTLLTLVSLLVLVGAIAGFAKLNQSYNTTNPVPNIKVQGTAEQIARGEKFANFCANCHGNHGNLPLSGQDFTEGGGPPFGTLFAPNLTPAGDLKNWSDGEIVRAIREGVHKNGRSLVIMPSDIFHNMSDADVQSIVAYLRSTPAVTPDTPVNNLNIIGALFVNVVPAQTHQAAITQPIVAPPAGTTADYGTYLVNVIGCRQCHGPDLAGGVADPNGGPPAGPNLTVLVPKWSEAEFMKTIRTGTDPTGKQLNPDEMPWKNISAFASDDDLKAMFAYLKNLQPINK